MIIGLLPNMIGSLLLALSYVSLILLAVKKNLLTTITAYLARVGQMAFTNYLLQTTICTTVFYDHGFGLSGEIDRLGQAINALSVWAFLIVFSYFWLAKFRFSPLEWFWRSLVYYQLQPMRIQN